MMNLSRKEPLNPDQTVIAGLSFYFSGLFPSISPLLTRLLPRPAVWSLPVAQHNHPGRGPCHRLLLGGLVTGGSWDPPSLLRSSSAALKCQADEAATPT